MQGKPICRFLIRRIDDQPIRGPICEGHLLNILGQLRPDVVHMDVAHLSIC